MALCRHYLQRFGRILHQIGRPVVDPQVVDVAIDGQHSTPLTRSEVDRIVWDELARVDDVTRGLVEERITVF